MFSVYLLSNLGSRNRDRHRSSLFCPNNARLLLYRTFSKIPSLFGRIGQLFVSPDTSTFLRFDMASKDYLSQILVGLLALHFEDMLHRGMTRVSARIMLLTALCPKGLTQHLSAWHLAITQYSPS